MSVKNDFIKPIIVLLLICLFVSGALAVVNFFTKDVIEQAAAERAEAEMRKIIPNTSYIELLETANLGLPRSVTNIYLTRNDTGYIFKLTVSGYGVKGIQLLCGVDTEGKIIKGTVLAHDETQGLGTPIFEQPHAGQYEGKDIIGIEDIDSISGATITSNAYKKAMRDALTAYEIVSIHLQKEAQE